MNSRTDWERAYLQAHPIEPRPLGWRWYAGLAVEVLVALVVVMAVIAVMSVA